MNPTLLDGDIVLYRAFPGKDILEKGMVVVARLNLLQRFQAGNLLFPPIVKRVAHINGAQTWLIGDNHEASIDSRRLGYFSIDQIKGIIVDVIHKQG